MCGMRQNTLVSTNEYLPLTNDGWFLSLFNRLNKCLKQALEG